MERVRNIICYDFEEFINMLMMEVVICVLLRGGVGDLNWIM